MQGTVLSVASTNGEGIIKGDDGAGYTFTLASWRNPSVAASPGMRVDFEIQGTRAVGIYLLSEAAPPPTAQQPPTAPAASPAPPLQQAGTSPNTSFAPPSQPASSTQAGQLHPLINLYFNPSGRINRSTFWLKGVLLLGLIWVAIYAISTLLLVSLSDVSLAMYTEAVVAGDPAAFVLRLVVNNFSPIPDIYGFVKFQVEFAGIFYQLTSESLAGVFVFWISSLIHMWIGFAVVAKRLHDTDRPGWWMLAWVGGYAVGMLTTPFFIGWFILLALFIWILVWLGFQEGTPERNRYGEPQQTTGGTRSAGQPRTAPRPATAPSPHWMFQLPAILSVIFAGLVIVAAFLPWITVSAFFGGDSSGIEGGTGIFTLILGVAAGASALFGLSTQQSRQARVIWTAVRFLSAVTIIIVALLVMTGDSSPYWVEIRAGLKMTLVGGIGLAVANCGWVLSFLFTPRGSQNP